MRRVVVLLGSLALLLVGLTACGDDDGSTENTGKVTVSGDFGSQPKVTYDGEVNRATTSTKVLTEGTGATVEEGDHALVHLYIGNGFTGEKSLSTYDQKTPQVVPVTKDALPALRKAMVGKKAGSRIEVLSSPKDAFGESGNPDLYIGNGDSVVFVVDILDTVLDAPEGTEQKAPSSAPTVVEKDGKVTGLDFSKAGKPSKKLKVITLTEGEGAPIKKKSYAVVRYLGQTYDGKKPFDESFSSETLEARQVGVGGYIKGWDKGLIGVKAGSRVMLLVPPSEGYGKAGQGKDIQGDDTMAFVIDVLAVS
ncbi:MAG: FKBP-type peptidyl-prolyl cis-trans isomerase [Nocardioides sp.]